MWVVSGRHIRHHVMTASGRWCVAAGEVKAVCSGTAAARLLGFEAGPLTVQPGASQEALCHINGSSSSDGQVSTQGRQPHKRARGADAAEPPPPAAAGAAGGDTLEVVEEPQGEPLPLLAALEARVTALCAVDDSNGAAAWLEGVLTATWAEQPATPTDTPTEGGGSGSQWGGLAELMDKVDFFWGSSVPLTPQQQQEDDAAEAGMRAALETPQGQQQQQQQQPRQR